MCVQMVYDVPQVFYHSLQLSIDTTRQLVPTAAKVKQITTNYTVLGLFSCKNDGMVIMHS